MTKSMAINVREPIAGATRNSSPSNPLISHEKLRQLYSMMLKCRLLDAYLRVAENRAGIANDHHASAGLEATAVGAAIDLWRGDTLAPPPHRDLILSYLKGVPLHAMLSQLFRGNKGRSASFDCEQAALNIVSSASTFATQLDTCIEMAFANQRKKNNNIVMVFSGEGSIPLSDWHDALRFAGQRSLPIVFVRPSHLSGGSVLVNPESASDNTRSEAVEYGFPQIAVDGNDAIAVYRVAHEATERARSDGGPTLINAQSFPEPGAVDIAHSQQSAEDRPAERESNDPIAAMEVYLKVKELFSERWKNDVIAAFKEELNAAVGSAENDTCG